MALHPQAQAFIDKLRAANAKPWHQMAPQEARDAYRTAVQLFGGTADPVAKVEDRTVAGPHGTIPIRLYTPAGNPPFAAMVLIHGGGWVVGDIELNDICARALANSAGCVVVSPDYRLAPEHLYPAAVDDCYVVTKWTHDNAASIGVNPRQIGVGGDSAGGNLAAAVTLMARDRGGPPLAFQLLIYPVTDYNFDNASYRDCGGGENGLSTPDMRYFWDLYLPNAAAGAEVYASPLRAKDLKGLPPAHVITAEFDPLRDEGEQYVQKLKAAGVPVTHHRYAGAIHGFWSLAGIMDQGKESYAEAGAALKKALGR